jgi:2-oxoglutarate dehydrogenase complex dehydrogenase (E1) component-like enzyme
MRRILSTSMPLLFRQNSRFSEVARFQNNFLNTTNLAYIESLYSKWLVDKSSVSPSFSAYFDLLQKGTDPHDAFEHPSTATNLGNLSAAAKEIGNQLKMRLMIDTYRTIGHQFAKIDPLDLPQNKDLHGRLPEDSLSATNFGYKK